MRDVVMLLTIVAFFALCIAYVAWCDRIIGPDPSPADLESEADEAVAIASVWGEDPVRHAGRLQALRRPHRGKVPL